MKIVRKGNKQLQVSDERLDEMTRRGFVEIDPKTNKPIKKDPKDELAALKKENAVLKKKVQELEAQLTALTNKA
jgi:polyhydroxyalkanoate synthesis regulator phasin